MTPSSCAAGRLAAGALCALMLGPGQASELEALELADKAEPSAPARPQRMWQAYVEAAVQRDLARTPGADGNIARLSLDFRLDTRPMPAWRLVASNRLDLVDSDGGNTTRSVNTLREAFVSWAPAADWAVDLGRVNLRNGVAMGFNPTDWFKENAVRVAFSADPMALRENRQGTVVLQAQKLWDMGAFSLSASPKLAEGVDRDTFAINAGATNPRDRWLASGTLKLSDTFSPQLLVQGGQDQHTQWGLNLSTLAGNATVVYVEWSTGRSPSLASKALGSSTEGPRQRRAAAGLTYTLPINLSVTLEGHYSSAGMSGSEWSATDVQPGAQLQVLNAAQAWQDLPSRRAWFAHFRWKDALLPRLELSGYLRRESTTQSSTAWLEARYRLDRLDLAMQWRRFYGPDGSIFGVVPNRQTIELACRYFL